MNMTLSVESVGVGCLWLTVVLRAPGMVRRRDQRALWAAVVLVGLLTTLYMSAVQSGLAQLASEYVVYLGTHVTSVAAAAATLHFLLLAHDLRRRTWWLHAATGCTVAAMLWTYIAVSPADPRPGHAPELPLAYFFLVSLFSLVALGLCALICATSSRRADHWALRWGLLLLSGGWLLNTLPWLLNLAWLITDNDGWIAWFAQIDGVSALCLAAGTALPAIPALQARSRDRRTYRRLDPLWRSLTHDAPDVVLDHAVRWPRALLTPVPWRLERRLAEIRDAMLFLGNYIGTDELSAVRAHVHSSDEIPAGQSEPHVTACWLTAAQQHKRNGATARAHGIDLSETGDDRDQEIQYLLRVAEAARSPLARSYATTTGAAS